MSTVLSYLRSGKSVNVDDDDECKRKSSTTFAGFPVNENLNESKTKSSKGKSTSKSNVSDSSGDANVAGTSSSGSGEQVGPTDSASPPPPSNPSSGPPPPPPPGPSDDPSDVSDSSDDDDESDEAAVESDSSSSSGSMFGAGDSRVMESMVFRGPKEFLEAFYTLVNDMESLDVKLTPSEVYTYLINALGNSPKYESVRMTARGLVHVTAGDPNPKLISSLLLSLEDASKNSSTSKSSTSTGSAMAASDQSGNNNNKRNRNRNKSRSSNSNSSSNSSNGNGDRSGNNGFVQAKDRRNCPQNGDSSRNNGGNGSSSGTSGTSGPSGSSGSSGPRPSLALGLSTPFSEKKKNLLLDDRRRSEIVDEFVKDRFGRSSFGDSVAISNFGDSTALNLGEENAYVETNDDDGVDFITFVVDSGATSHFLKHRGVLHDERKINESLQSAHCEVSLIKEGVEVDETRKIHDVINDHLLKTSVSVSVSDVNIVPTVTPVSNVDSAPGCSNWINPDELTEAERSGDNLVDRSLIDTSSSDEPIAVANTVESKRTRHIDVCYHHIRDLVTKQIIYLQKISSADQLADILTKATTLFTNTGIDKKQQVLRLFKWYAC
ncbi:uncharacterized protein DDB_G0283357-like [Planococcus citri]|uniref:uncharacterized protein DDB_G0283357-like n=1 Tax=Planococcus citri TaxID=170843 RepID=UPI0031F94D76